MEKIDTTAPNHWFMRIFLLNIPCLIPPCGDFSGILHTHKSIPPGIFKHVMGFFPYLGICFTARSIFNLMRKISNALILKQAFCRIFLQQWGGYMKVKYLQKNKEESLFNLKYKMPHECVLNFQTFSYFNSF